MKQVSTIIRALVVSAFIAAGVLASGCRSTMVSVTSNPPGAKVYSRGCGRIGYTWEDKGNTPVVFPSGFSSQNTMVLWPDGIRSEVQYSRIAGKDTVDLYFDKKNAVGKVATAAGTNNPAGK